MSSGQYIDIPGVAQTTLDWVVAHFAASSVELPSLRYIGPGATRELAWDCEEVLASCGGILWGQGQGVGAGTGRRTGNPVSSGGTRYATFNIQIVRCVPSSAELDDIDALNASGVTILKDAGLLSQALAELCGPRGPLKRAGVATAGNVEILGPAGGFAATEGQLLVTTAQLVPG